MSLEEILYGGGAIAIFLFVIAAIYAILVLLIPLFLLGIYRQAQETNRLLSKIAKRIRTGEDNASAELLTLLLRHTEQRDGFTYRDQSAAEGNEAA